MKTKNLIILVCVAAALVAVAVLTTDKGRTAKKTVNSELVFKGLPVNDVTRIEITQQGKSMRIMRKDGEWVAIDKFSYPVKFDRVKEALIGLAELKAGDERNLNDKQRARVKMFSPLDEKAEAESKGSLVAVYTSGNDPAASLLIGGSRNSESATPGAGADGTYISPDGGKTILLTSQFMGYIQNADPMAWINSEILSINSFTITNITIAPYDEDPVTLYGDEKGELTMTKIPWRKKLDENKVRAVRFALSYLRFAEVADPALSDEDMGFDKPSVFTVATSEDLVYSVTLGGNIAGSNDRYLRASAKFVGKLPPEQDTDEAGKKIAETVKKVESTNARLAKWTYVVPASSADPMLFTRDNLVTKKNE